MTRLSIEPPRGDIGDIFGGSYIKDVYFLETNVASPGDAS